LERFTGSVEKKLIILNILIFIFLGRQFRLRKRRRKFLANIVSRIEIKSNNFFHLVFPKNIKVTEKRNLEKISFSFSQKKFMFSNILDL